MKKYLNIQNFLILLILIINVICLILINNDTETVIDNNIKVEIKGAVNKPGVYTLKQNERIVDLVKKSGGLKKDADTSTINLSKKLNDGNVVIIYTIDEIKEMLVGNASVKIIEKECVCPTIENDGCIESVIKNNSIENKTNKVSLNSGTLKEIMTLPGIGETKAKAIIQYREENQGFKKIEDIMNVKGIGKSTYEKLKDFLML